jgi:hypothetical protein
MEVRMARLGASLALCSSVLLPPDYPLPQSIDGRRNLSVIDTL